MSEKNIAVAGCGHWGKNLVRNFSELGALAAITDPHVETAQKFSQHYNVPALSWEECLEHEAVKAAVLASPAPLHYAMAKKALEAGKDVYVEKPITLDSAEAQELCELAKTRGLILMVGHLLHYHPGFLKMKELVQGGKVGKILSIVSNRLSFGKVRRQENVLWSFAPHDISMILSLAGDQSPLSVQAQALYLTHEKIADSCSVFMTFQNGVAAQINASWLYPYKEQRLMVVGDKGALVFDDQNSWEEKLIFYPHQIEGKGEVVPHLEKAEGEYVPLIEGEPLKNECQHFIECIKNRTTPRTDGAEGKRVLDVLMQAQESLDSSSKNKRKQAA